MSRIWNLEQAKFMDIDPIEIEDNIAHAPQTLTCRYCEFKANPLGSHYCGKCGMNIAVDNHIWKIYDTNCYSVYSKEGNRVIAEYKYKEYIAYEKIAKSSYKYKMQLWWKENKEAVLIYSIGFGILGVFMALINWLING